MNPPEHAPSPSDALIDRATEPMSPRTRPISLGSDESRLSPHVIFAPLFWAWFRATTSEEREWYYPTGPAVVSVAGIDPVRILVIGDGPAAGCGVLTHHLGLAGHLARHVSDRVGRGVVVKVAAQPDASARSTLKQLGRIDLDGYDAIVLMLATTDAFCLTPRSSWRRSMTRLVGALQSTQTSVFVTSISHMDLARSLSPFARMLTGSHARLLNAETSRICEEYRTPMIRLDAANDLVPRTYATWARRIGAHIVESVHERRA